MEFDEIKKKIDKYLKDYFYKRDGYNKLLYEAMGYSINVGGKRIRPMLMILTYSMYKSDYEKIMPMAAAMEMIHTYSLIHDDLPCMDNDDMRRGKPSNHKIFGDAVALLAGDGLLNEAFNSMLQCQIESDLKIKVMSIISKASSADGMIGGQIVDIINENRKIEKEQLEYMHNKKTGELITASIVSGAIMGGAQECEQNILLEYGKVLGLAFQIQDDILDVEGDKEKMGKNTHMDENKSTFVNVYGLDKCKSMLASLEEQCKELINSLKGDTKKIMEITNMLFKRQY
ncbi:farnesyl-diphosphate synthase [Hathewaya proteolytica DSM 3090]|uniref:Farnesyl diphosphate synthase n=1 Tax=Hathewaya proteolytica DSM 3090 TaxID=1121331 RepID=A0A1M6L4I2_9CLOT|nr:farnesyl diphosphate synthase [Hathewaya proteolytica]SHJ66096.1 farnesyl-diphosphate synthase [Hathewaya proteolytica DSM 3090]